MPVPGHDPLNRSTSSPTPEAGGGGLPLQDRDAFPLEAERTPLGTVIPAHLQRKVSWRASTQLAYLPRELSPLARVMRAIIEWFNPDTPRIQPRPHADRTRFPRIPLVLPSTPESARISNALARTIRENGPLIRPLRTRDAVSMPTYSGPPDEYSLSEEP